MAKFFQPCDTLTNHPFVALSPAVPNVTVSTHMEGMYCCEVSPRDGRERQAIWGFPWGRIDPGSAALYVFSPVECSN